MIPLQIMDKLLLSFLVVILSIQMAFDHDYKYVVMGAFVSLALWYGYCLLIRPLDIRRVILLFLSIRQYNCYAGIFCCLKNIQIIYVFYYKMQRQADVGYEQHSTQKQWLSNDKLHLVKSMMKFRKKGTLPPVYPNGWFALLDSDQLNVEQVQYITALGNNFIFEKFTETALETSVGKLQMSVSRNRPSHLCPVLDRTSRVQKFIETSARHRVYIII